MPPAAITFRLLAAASVLAVGAASATTLRELPRGAHAGECFSRTTVAATYRTDRLAVPQPPLIGWRDIPAVYRIETKQVLVSPGRVDHRVIPAVMGTRVRWIEHRGADRVVETAPVYRWVEQRIQISRAHLVWRRGHASQGYSDADYSQSTSVSPTGEVMCRVLIPARYEIRRVRMLVRSGRTCVIRGPSHHERLVEHFVVSPQRVIDHTIAPIYRTISNRVLVTPGRHVRIETPRPPRFITHRVEVTPAHTRWSPMVCSESHMHHAFMEREAPPSAYGATPMAHPCCAQSYTPDYARPHTGMLEGAPTPPSYRAPPVGHGYAPGSPSD